MVVQVKACKSLLSQIPVIDLSKPEEAKRIMVKACEEYGFFKVVGHGVPMEVIEELEKEAVWFFKKAECEKEKAGPPDPFGYGSKRIGSNGDVGWVEYVVVNTNPDVKSTKSDFILQQSPHHFRCAVEDYVAAVKRMSCHILDLMGDGLAPGLGNLLASFLTDHRSDSCFRLNHYPPCPTPSSVIGFGDHTDPQIISVLRSNATSGLQICLPTDTWVSVPSDRNAFFVNVGDTLQVLTNGRFKSVRHRVVVADTTKSRFSMIYFGGAALGQRIAPLPPLIPNGHHSLYRDFTWSDYKKAAYSSRLSDNRLAPFHNP